MATVQEHPAPPRASERIRHPLQAVRATIRKYVLLEGAALAVMFLALWFWVGLALDWGLFSLLSFDWVLELQNLDESKSIAFYIRLVILLVMISALIALAISKMVMRLTKEFSDSAVALVLERRFPRELGDRLITAVEMADPKQAAALGYSRVMIDKTIQEAGERVASLPVADVFDWARLRKQWFRAGLLTLGMFVLVGACYCANQAILNAIFGELREDERGNAPSASPIAFLSEFGDVSAIWAERNLLLQDSYWPRQAYLEVLRFADTPAHPGEMRVGRDEQRPDLMVRAVQWVVADRRSPDGWRALRWSDVPKFVSKDLVDKVTLPSDSPWWLIDLDDLSPDVPLSAVPASWQGKRAGEVRAELQLDSVQASLQRAKATKAVDDLLDWREWTVDRLKLQDDHSEVRRHLRERHEDAYNALEDVFEKLEEVAAKSSMSRSLRKLRVPARVEIVYRGETMKTSSHSEQKSNNKYAIDLNELKESGRFRVRGEDYWTRPQRITLAPPPGVVSVAVDKEEPAYLYYRLQGKQAPLKGKKQIFTDYAVSATGDTTTIDVPYGTNVTLKVKVDRPLQELIQIRAPGAGLKETGSVVPNSPVIRDDDAKGYSARFANVVKMLEFNVDYSDDDNVKGKRRFRIRPIDDAPPEIISVELAAVLRKPRFKAEPGKTGGGLSIDGYMITPDALVPFLGTLRDDYGLTKADWLFDTELVDIQLTGGAEGSKDRSGLILAQGNPRVRRGGLIASGMQFHPGALQTPVSLAYWGWVRHLFDAAAKHKSGAGEESAPMDTFLKRLEERSIDEIPLAVLEQKLKEKPAGRPRFKEHVLKEEEGFDVRRHLARIKTQDPVREPQPLYFLRLSIAATDNNIETGPSSSRTKAPFFFLIISENDLLSQVAMEEEVLGERLERVIEKLNAARISVSDQINKLPSAGDANLLSLIAIRADEVRKAVLDGASVTREMHSDFSRILKELQVNRVRRLKVEEVNTKIVIPLEDVINPNFGEFQTTEDAAQKFYQALDDDSSGKKTPNIDAHLASARLTREQLEKLIDRLNAISIAITEGINEARNLENLMMISRNQDDIARRFRTFHEHRVLEIIQELTQPKKTP